MFCYYVCDVQYMSVASVWSLYVCGLSVVFTLFLWYSQYTVCDVHYMSVAFIAACDVHSTFVLLTARSCLSCSLYICDVRCMPVMLVMFAAYLWCSLQVCSLFVCDDRLRSVVLTACLSISGPGPDQAFVAGHRADSAAGPLLQELTPHSGVSPAYSEIHCQCHTKVVSVVTRMTV